MTDKEALKILNLKENFTEKELKKAYRDAVKKYHPDGNKDPGAEEKFKKIGNAYAVLKNLGIQPKRETYYGQDDLSIFKMKILEKMWEMVDLKEIESFSYSYLWFNYIHKMYGIHDSYYDKIKESFTKEKIEQLNKEFEEEFYNRMNLFDDYFFGIHSYFKNRKKVTFKTIEEQLGFYKKLMEEIPEKVSEIVIPLIENTVEYKVAKNLLNVREDYFNSIIIKKMKEELAQEKHFIKSLREIAIEIIASEIKEKREGRIILHILSFIRKAESLSLLYNYIGSFSTKDGIRNFLLDRVIRLSTQREAYANKKQVLKLCQDIVFDKDFYLKSIWKHMSSFLEELICEKDFARNQDIYNKFGKYPLEIIALAKNGIISVDTLMQVEDALCGDYDAERILKVLEYALNITDDTIINPDYLFISLEENIENPLAVLHRGERNYEIFSENELGRIEKEEIDNPILQGGAIMGYVPIKKVFLNADFIGKKIGNLDIICWYEGLYLTMDIYGNIKFCSEEQINAAEFTDGNESLRDPEAILKILCDKANIKYASQLNGKNGKWLYYK